MIGLIALPYPMAWSSGGGGTMSAFPATNLQNNDYGRMMGVDNTGGAQSGNAEVFDLGDARAVDTLALLWHTAVGYSSPVVRVTASNSADGLTNALYDSGYTPSVTGQTQREQLAYWKWLRTLPTSVTARYWRVEMSVGPNMLQFASRFFVGKGATFAIGPQKVVLGAKDLNNSITTEVGEVRSQEDPQLIRPVISLSFEYAKQSEMEKLLGAYTLNIGTSRPLLICSDLTSPYLQDNIAFGRLEKVIQLESSVYDIWSFEAIVTSLGV